MNRLQKFGLSSVGSGFAALAILPILLVKDNTSIVISEHTMYFAGVGLTWLGNRLFGAMAIKRSG